MNSTSPTSHDDAGPDHDFYVEPGCCMLCGEPEGIAPEVFETGENHCFVKRQPSSQDQVDRTIRAMWSSEADCIRYRGRDAGLLDRIARAGMISLTDHPPSVDAPPTGRDRVSFSMPMGRFAGSALQVANALRTDMRTSGNKVLPSVFGRRTVWISWFENRFHGVQLTDQRDGRFVAHLRTRFALQGLAWLVDDWLRTTGAEDICWEATADPTAASPTPM
jgi:hypothetical protein